MPGAAPAAGASAGVRSSAFFAHRYLEKEPLYLHAEIFRSLMTMRGSYVSSPAPLADPSPTPP